MVITFNLRKLVVYLRRLKFHLAFSEDGALTAGCFFIAVNVLLI